MRVVGLDLSLTATGLALPDGTVWNSRAAGQSRGMHRLAVLRQWVIDSIPGDTDLVVIEGYSFGSRNSQAHALGELGGVVRLKLWQEGVPYVDVPPASLKKFATGKGNANKELMLVSAVRRLGYEDSDNNEADALWLRAMGMQAMGEPVVELPQSHLDALSKVDWPIERVA